MARKIFALLLLIVLASGCDNSSGGDQARVRLIQASTMGQPLSLFIDADLLATLLYGDVSSYDEIDDTIHTVRGQVGLSDVFSIQANFDKDTDYSILTVQEGGTVTPVILVDDNSRPDFDNFRLRAINAASRAQLVDIYALRENESVVNHEPNFTNLIFKQGSNYDQIDNTEYVLWATVAGTKTVLAQAPSQRFDNAQTWSAILEDDSNSSGVVFVLKKDRDNDDFSF